MCRKKWGLTDNEMCVCGDIEIVSHIVDFFPLTKFVSSLHVAVEAAVDWLTYAPRRI